MSVPQSERRQSEHEYIVILQQIEQYFLDMCKNKNLKDPILTHHILDLSMEAYDSATMYFELCNGKIGGDLGSKKKYCKLTIYKARQVASQLNILIAQKLRENKRTNGLVEQTAKLLKVCDLLQEQLKILNKQEK